jgi:hypothetical protein
MRIAITFPDDIAKKVCRPPDRDAFVTQAVAEALAQAPQASQKGRSRWARLVERIEKSAQTLGEHRETFDRDRKEFRESLRFDHDDHG